MSTCRLRIAFELTLEVGVGQVIERHRAFQSKQAAHPLEDERLDACLMTQQQIGGPVQSHERHAREIEFEHLAKGRLVLQPAPGGELRSRSGHAADHVADGGCALAAIETQPLQRFDETDLAHHRQSHVLDAHRARLEHLHRVRIHFDKRPRGLRRRARARDLHALSLTQQQLRCVALRELLQ